MYDIIHSFLIIAAPFLLSCYVRCQHLRARYNTVTPVLRSIFKSLNIKTHAKIFLHARKYNRSDNVVEKMTTRKGKRNGKDMR